MINKQVLTVGPRRVLTETVRALASTQNEAELVAEMQENISDFSKPEDANWMNMHFLQVVEDSDKTVPTLPNKRSSTRSMSF